MSRHHRNHLRNRCPEWRRKILSSLDSFTLNFFSKLSLLQFLFLLKLLVIFSFFLFMRRKLIIIFMAAINLFSKLFFFNRELSFNLFLFVLVIRLLFRIIVQSFGLD